MDEQDRDEILWRLDERTKRVDDHLNRLDERVEEIEGEVDNHDERITDNEDTIAAAAKAGGGVFAMLTAALGGLAAKVAGFFHI